ncbi:unnamed protein product [Prorocentrum cordatum]|uniref:Elongation factor EFG domain-containing protein n=1 Tax=Prorocentrum cordatum TaxID=2364126 RepID=A0ABN9S2L5_9DINO|nr:unnamed protein product [Polarella glacialis]
MGSPLGSALPRGLQRAGPGGVPLTDVVVRVTGAEAKCAETAANAAAAAVEAAVQKAVQEGPGLTLLEPVADLELDVPLSFVEMVREDLQHHRRGQVWDARDAEEGHQLIEAEAPVREILDYAAQLQKLTDGQGVYSWQRRMLGTGSEAVYELLFLLFLRAWPEMEMCQGVRLLLALLLRSRSICRGRLRDLGRLALWISGMKKRLFVGTEFFVDRKARGPPGRAAMGARRARRGPALLLAAAALRGAARPEEGRGGLEEVEAEEGLEEFDLSPEESRTCWRALTTPRAGGWSGSCWSTSWGPAASRWRSPWRGRSGCSTIGRWTTRGGRLWPGLRMAELAKSLWADAGGSAVERRFLKKLTQVQTGSDDASFGAQAAPLLGPDAPFPFVVGPGEQAPRVRWRDLMPECMYDRTVRDVAIRVHEEKNDEPIPLQCVVGPAVPIAFFALCVTWMAWEAVPVFAQTLSKPPTSDLQFHWANWYCETFAMVFWGAVLWAMVCLDFRCAKYAWIPQLQLTTHFSVLGFKTKWSTFLVVESVVSFIGKVDLITSGLFLAAAQEVANEQTHLGSQVHCVWSEIHPWSPLSLVGLVSVSWWAMLLQPAFLIVKAMPAQTLRYWFNSLGGDRGERWWQSIKRCRRWKNDRGSEDPQRYDVESYEVRYLEATSESALAFMDKRANDHSRGHYYPTLLCSGDEMSSHSTAFWPLADASRMQLATTMRSEYTRLLVRACLDRGNEKSAGGHMKRQMESIIVKVFFSGIVQALFQLNLSLELLNMARAVTGEFPRTAGLAAFVTLVNIMKTLKDAFKVHAWISKHDLSAFREVERRNALRRRTIQLRCVIVLHTVLMFATAIKLWLVMQPLLDPSICPQGLFQFDALGCVKLPPKCLYGA